MVPHEREAVGRHRVVLELIPGLEAAAFGLKKVGERVFCFASEAHLRERSHGVGTVAQPRDRPLAGRKAREERTLATVDHGAG